MLRIICSCCANGGPDPKPGMAGGADKVQVREKPASFGAGIFLGLIVAAAIIAAVNRLVASQLQAMSDAHRVNYAPRSTQTHSTSSARRRAGRATAYRAPRRTTPRERPRHDGGTCATWRRRGRGARALRDPPAGARARRCRAAASRRRRRDSDGGGAGGSMVAAVQVMPGTKTRARVRTGTDIAGGCEGAIAAARVSR